MGAFATVLVAMVAGALRVSTLTSLPELSEMNQMNQMSEMDEMDESALRPNLGPPPPRPDWRRGRQS